MKAVKQDADSEGPKFAEGVRKNLKNQEPIEREKFLSDLRYEKMPNRHTKVRTEDIQNIYSSSGALDGLHQALSHTTQL